jgi:uncharacterized protein with von Willebrand factor type A (vWA) domain
MAAEKRRTNVDKKQKPTEGPDQVFEMGQWERYQWERAQDESPGIAVKVAELGQKLDSAPRFTREVFGQLWSPVNLPEVDAKSAKPEDAWARRAHEELKDLPEWSHLRTRCMGDRTAAGVGCTAMASFIADRFPPPNPKPEDPQPLREQVKSLLDFAKAIRSQGGSETAAQEIDAEIARLRARGKAAVQGHQAYLDAKVDETVLRAVLKAAAGEAEQAIAAVEEGQGGFGGWGDQVGTPRDTSAAEKAALARVIVNNVKLQAIAKEAGRLRHIAARKQASKSQYLRSELSDVEQGNAIDRLLPSELVALSDPTRALDFGRRFLEGQLLQYKLTGKERQGRGPIVVCVDDSGSMRGEKEVWAKGMAIALVDIAVRQKRDCLVVNFDEGVTQQRLWSAPIDAVGLAESMIPFSGGGTNFDEPMMVALDEIEGTPKLKKADVVIITDGEGELSDATVERLADVRRRIGVTVYAIHIGSQVPAVLTRLADKIVGLASIADEGEATEEVFAI